MRGPIVRVAAMALAIFAGACGAQTAGVDLDLAGANAYRPASAGDRGVPSSSLGDYLAGNYALDAGLINEAAGFYERALAADPDNLELLQQLHLLTLAAGRYEQALEQSARLSEISAVPDEAILLLALQDVREQRFEAARARLDAIGSNGIAALAVPFLDAWAMFGARGEAGVGNAIARLEAGESLGPLNDFHTAMLLDLGGTDDDALQVLREAMPDNGARAPARMAQAFASLAARAGSTDEALSFLRQQQADGREQPILEHAVDRLERGEAPARPFEDSAGGMADALLGIAEALHQERSGARAVVFARLASFVRPDLAESAILIGDIMAEQENYEAAIAAYQEVEPDSAFGQVAGLRLARTLHALERKDEAYDTLRDLAEREPERTEALIQLGDLLRRDEEYAEAEEAYSRALERLGEPALEDWTLFYARGITYERTKRWEQAEADFLQALELEPEQPFVLNYLGYSWVDMGMNLDQAKGMLNRAVELRPNDGFIVDSLGWVHYRLGEYRDAVVQLERAVELEPGDPVINDHLGDAYWRVGRTREARYQWQRALSLEPEEDQIAEIERKLKSGLPEQPTSDVNRS